MGLVGLQSGRDSAWSTAGIQILQLLQETVELIAPPLGSMHPKKWYGRKKKRWQDAISFVAAAFDVIMKLICSDNGNRIQ